MIEDLYGVVCHLGEEWLLVVLVIMQQDVLIDKTIKKKNLKLKTIKIREYAQNVTKNNKKPLFFLNNFFSPLCSIHKNGKKKFDYKNFF